MMRIKSAQLRIWSFRLNFSFDEGVNVLIGPNGCGKTTFLNVLAGVTGNDAATDRIHGLEVKDFSVTVATENGDKSFTTSGFLDRDAIREFKAQLPGRTSFAVQEDYFDESLITERLDSTLAAEAIRGVFTSNRNNRNETVKRNRHLHLSNCGDGFHQQVRILTRLAPTNIPMLIEYPERHVDYGGRWALARALDVGGQYFVTTHCPETFSSLDSIGKAVDFSASSG